MERGKTALAGVSRNLRRRCDALAKTAEVRLDLSDTIQKTVD